MVRMSTTPTKKRPRGRLPSRRARSKAKRSSPLNSVTRLGLHSVSRCTPRDTERCTTTPTYTHLRCAQNFFPTTKQRIDSIPVAMGGTRFQRKLWAELRRIPAGTTTTYAKLAKVIGHPNAWRAVGRAVGANPINVVVLCHRVIASNGTLTGYGSGIERKQWLLECEFSHAQRQVRNVTPGRQFNNG
jgi:O-6-methylguanine DNA methyltransferase